LIHLFPDRKLLQVEKNSGSDGRLKIGNYVLSFTARDQGNESPSYVCIDIPDMDRLLSERPHLLQLRQLATCRISNLSSKCFDFKGLSSEEVTLFGCLHSFSVCDSICTVLFADEFTWTDSTAQVGAQRRRIVAF
jgi:hypothetical protein